MRVADAVLMADVRNT